LKSIVAIMVLTYSAWTIQRLTPEPSSMPPRQSPARLVQWLIVLPVLLVWGGILFGAYAMIASSVPDEAKLVTLTGRLEDLRVVTTKDRDVVYTMLITPASGAAVSVHMRAFGARTLTDALSRAEGREVVVRYRKALLGNPAYAVAGPDGDILPFAQTRTFLQAEDAAKGADKWGGLILYGLGPLLMITIVWWRGRSAPVPAPTSLARTDNAAFEHRLATVRLLFGMMMALGGILIALHGVPANFTRVFGSRPFGLDPMAAYLTLTGLAFAPLVWAGWSLAAVIMLMQRRDGILRTGKLSMTRGIYQYWEDPVIRGLTWRVLAGAAVFLGLVLVWGVAAG
jgi:hypothetical protein